jgi:hypothetical protein
MSRRRTRAAAGAILSGLLIATLGVTGAMAAGDADDGCELSVSPRSGPAGTEFVFTGSGYTPTVLRLTQGDGEPTEIDLDLGDADPFEINVIAREGDEGTWTAEAIVPDTECVGTATITVTLPPTTTVVDAATPMPGTDTRTPVLVVMAGLAAVFVVSSRLLLGRVHRRT